jgi:imidazolonepropionase-like amidohydrolase
VTSPKFLPFFFLAASFAYADTLWLKGGSLVDPATQKIQKIDLKISNGLLHQEKSVGKPGTGDGVVDISGKFIIPGIYDMHVHSSFGNPAPGGVHQRLTPLQTSELVLRGGVTGFLDLFADENQIFEARASVRASHLGADIFAAGPMFTCPGGHGSDLYYPTRTVSNPKQAEEQVSELAKKHPDVIKIAYDHAGEEGPPKPVIDLATLRALIRTAKRLKFKTVVHIGNWEDAKAAVNAGADVITHLYETDIPDDLVALMKQKHVIEIPTMSYQTELLHQLENRRLVSAPLLTALIPPEVLEAYRSMNPAESYTKRILDWQVRGRDSYSRSLAKLIKAGIPILSGTDAGDLGVFHGYSIHREMQMMVDAGASPWTALASTTTAAKRFLGRGPGIHEGERADFVVLNGNPIEDISQTQNIEMVFHSGKLLETKKQLATSH